MSSLSGHTIRGYNRREFIGAGGFGAVYRAHEPSVDRGVATKVILAQHANEANFIRGFEAERAAWRTWNTRLSFPCTKLEGAYLVMRCTTP